jgi:hypothetical protein
VSLHVLLQQRGRIVVLQSAKDFAMRPMELGRNPAPNFQPDHCHRPEIIVASKRAEPEDDVLTFDAAADATAQAAMTGEHRQLRDQIYKRLARAGFDLCLATIPCMFICKFLQAPDAEKSYCGRSSNCCSSARWASRVQIRSDRSRDKSGRTHDISHCICCYCCTVHAPYGSLASTARSTAGST